MLFIFVCFVRGNFRAKIYTNAMREFYFFIYFWWVLPGSRLYAKDNSKDDSCTIQKKTKMCIKCSSAQIHQTCGTRIEGRVCRGISCSEFPGIQKWVRTKYSGFTVKQDKLAQKIQASAMRKKTSWRICFCLQRACTCTTLDKKKKRTIREICGEKNTVRSCDHAW